MQLQSSDGTASHLKRYTREPISESWSWRGDRSWHYFSHDDCALISAAKRAGRDKVCIYAGGQRYQVDLNAMKQQNTRTNFCRNIRCQDQSTPRERQKHEPLPPGSLVPEEVIQVTGSRSSPETADLVNDILSAAKRPHAATIEKGSECSICFDDFSEDPPVLLEHCSSHYFHEGCIRQALEHSTRCPYCSRDYLPPMGNMPNGTLTIHRVPPGNPYYEAEGFEGQGTYILTFNFPGGVQEANHPHPGQPYPGTNRVAYLPDNKRGRKALALIKSAFRARHSFMIGMSSTTGRDDQIIWVVHMKTSLSGGSGNYGYPDDSYFTRLELECRDKGILYTGGEDEEEGKEEEEEKEEKL